MLARKKLSFHIRLLLHYQAISGADSETYVCLFDIHFFDIPYFMGILLSRVFRITVKITLLRVATLKLIVLIGTCHVPATYCDVGQRCDLQNKEQCMFQYSIANSCFGIGSLSHF